MVKYKVNLKFRDTGKSLNEIITEVLKIELQKKIDLTYNILKKESPLESNHYSRVEESSN